MSSDERAERERWNAALEEFGNRLRALLSPAKPAVCPTCDSEIQGTCFHEWHLKGNAQPVGETHTLPSMTAELRKREEQPASVETTADRPVADAPSEPEDAFHKWLDDFAYVPGNEVSLARAAFYAGMAVPQQEWLCRKCNYVYLGPPHLLSNYNRLVEEISVLRVTQMIFDEILNERRAQDVKWGGSQHDDTHSQEDWRDYIKEHTHKSVAGNFRKQMIRVAALAIAAIQSHDRLQAIFWRLPLAAAPPAGEGSAPK